MRFVAGADAIPAVETKAHELLATGRGSRGLGMDLALDDGSPV